MTTPTTTVPTEPSEAMLKRGGQEFAMTFQRAQTAETSARDVWQTMIGTGRYSYVSDPDILSAAPDPLPQGDLREAVARVIDEGAFPGVLGTNDPGHQRHMDRAFAKADAILALLTPARSGEGEADVQYEVWEGDEFCAGSDTLADARHYAMMYGQDGPVRIVVATTTRQPLPEAPSVGGEDV